VVFHTCIFCTLTKSGIFIKIKSGLIFNTAVILLSIYSTEKLPVCNVDIEKCLLWQFYHFKKLEKREGFSIS
jgi:hypothetical protein